jgi:hypothetical protein
MFRILPLLFGRLLRDGGQAPTRMAMRLLTFPSNQDVFWVVLGLAVLYGAARALSTDGSEKSTQIFDDSPWQLGILIGWPALYWFISHGVY